MDVRTNDSFLVDEFIEAHANDARCTEGVDDEYNMVKLKWNETKHNLQQAKQQRNTSQFISLKIPVQYS